MSENPAYLSEQIITYIGNKRKLLSFIGQGVLHAQQRLNQERLSTLDLFSGSGVVARYFKQYSSSLIVNDLEAYSREINECYLSAYTRFTASAYQEYYHIIKDRIDRGDFTEGFIRRLYSPQDESRIMPGERVFYTIRNALFIDTVRQFIGTLPPDLQAYFLAPLLSEASIHSNTAGVFKGFYKDVHSKTGQFGGTKRDALTRITADMQLKIPVFSEFDCDYRVYQQDANALVHELEEVDLAYLDPPYNQHPYGSNYFMLNLITDYLEPHQISKVSGIPKGWNKSDYNSITSAYTAFADLIQNLKAKFILISFNSEGFISHNEMMSLLKTQGKLSVLETKYNTFRACRNLKDRDKHLREYLYLLER